MTAVASLLGRSQKQITHPSTSFGSLLMVLLMPWHSPQGPLTALLLLRTYRLPQLTNELVALPDITVLLVLSAVPW